MFTSLTSWDIAWFSGLCVVAMWLKKNCWDPFIEEATKVFRRRSKELAKVYTNWLFDKLTGRTTKSASRHREK